MEESDPNIDLTQSAEAELTEREAWGAYRELLTALRDAIHLDDSQDPIDRAISALMTIAGSWTSAMVRAGLLPISLPFQSRGEVDLVATLLGVAGYTHYHRREFDELRSLFQELSNKPVNRNEFFPVGRDISFSDEKIVGI